MAINNEAPTAPEQTLVKTFINDARQLIPDATVSFVSRSTQPGEQGLLIGIDLPSDIAINSPKPSP